MKTAAHKTISAAFVREDAGSLAGLLGGICAAAGKTEAEAEEALGRWKAALFAAVGREPQGRLPVEAYHQMFRIFAEHSLDIINAAEGKP